MSSCFAGTPAGLLKLEQELACIVAEATLDNPVALSAAFRHLLFLLAGGVMVLHGQDRQCETSRSRRREAQAKTRRCLAEVLRRPPPTAPGAAPAPAIASAATVTYSSEVVVRIQFFVKALRYTLERGSPVDVHRLVRDVLLVITETNAPVVKATFDCLLVFLTEHSLAPDLGRRLLAETVRWLEALRYCGGSGTSVMLRPVSSASLDHLFGRLVVAGGGAAATQAQSPPHAPAPLTGQIMHQLAICFQLALISTEHRDVVLDRFIAAISGATAAARASGSSSSSSSSSSITTTTTTSSSSSSRADLPMLAACPFAITWHAATFLAHAATLEAADVVRGLHALFSACERAVAVAAGERSNTLLQASWNLEAALYVLCQRERHLFLGRSSSDIDSGGSVRSGSSSEKAWAPGVSSLEAPLWDLVMEIDGQGGSSGSSGSSGPGGGAGAQIGGQGELVSPLWSHMDEPVLVQFRELTRRHNFASWCRFPAAKIRRKRLWTDRKAAAAAAGTTTTRPDEPGEVAPPLVAAWPCDCCQDIYRCAGGAYARGVVRDGGGGGGGNERGDPAKKFPVRSRWAALIAAGVVRISGSVEAGAPCSSASSSSLAPAKRRESSLPLAPTDAATGDWDCTVVLMVPKPRSRDESPFEGNGEGDLRCSESTLTAGGAGANGKRARSNTDKTGKRAKKKKGGSRRRAEVPASWGDGNGLSWDSMPADVMSTVFSMLGDREPVKGGTVVVSGTGGSGGAPRSKSCEGSCEGNCEGSCGSSSSSSSSSSSACSEVAPAVSAAALRALWDVADRRAARVARKKKKQQLKKRQQQQQQQQQQCKRSQNEAPGAANDSEVAISTTTTTTTTTTATTSAGAHLGGSLGLLLQALSLPSTVLAAQCVSVAWRRAASVERTWHGWHEARWPTAGRGARIVCRHPPGHRHDWQALYRGRHRAEFPLAAEVLDRWWVRWQQSATDLGKSPSERRGGRRPRNSPQVRGGGGGGAVDAGSGSRSASGAGASGSGDVHTADAAALLPDAGASWALDIPFRLDWFKSVCRQCGCTKHFKKSTGLKQHELSCVQRRGSGAKQGLSKKGEVKKSSGKKKKKKKKKKQQQQKKSKRGGGRGGAGGEAAQ